MSYVRPTEEEIERKKYPYAFAFGDMQNALGVFGEAAKALAVYNTPNTRAEFELTRRECMRIYNVILTKLQRANISPDE